MPDGSIATDFTTECQASTRTPDREASALAFMTNLLPKTPWAYCQAAFALGDIENRSAGNRAEGSDLLWPLDDALTELALQMPATDLSDAVAHLSVGAFILDGLTDTALSEEDLHEQVIKLRRIFRSALPLVAQAADVDLGTTYAGGFMRYCAVLVARGEMPA
jgi:hypothetical protein